MTTLLKRRLQDFQARFGMTNAIQHADRVMTIYEPAAHRARPGQAIDALTYAYSTGPNYQQTLAMYAYNNWVMTAVSRLASRAASAALDIVNRSDAMLNYPDHPLLGLLGLFGKPNDYQDSYEFWELHFTQHDLTGNVFWWFDAPFGGIPTEVHLLDPDLMRVVPGVGQGISEYVYTLQGHEFHLSPRTVTHFKRVNPYNRYYGMSALEALKLEVISDRSMSKWNAEFFGEDVGVPAGVVVVPDTVPDTELERISDEFNGKHGGGRRRTAFLKSQPGGVAYLPAGIAPKDMDFTEGRMLSRKAVYEALELPLGLMSEASTEAHARVAERQLAESIATRQDRIERKLNVDVLPFWAGWRNKQAQFEDLSQRSADWDRELKHVQAAGKYLLRNEIRQDIFHKKPIPGWDEQDMQNASSSNGVEPSADGNSSDSTQQDRRDTRPVQQSG